MAKMRNNDVKDTYEKIMPFNAPDHSAKRIGKRIEIVKEDNRSLLFDSRQSQSVQELEPDLKELSESAMNCYHIGPEVVKTEHGFEVV